MGRGGRGPLGTTVQVAALIPRRHSPAEQSGGQYIPLREGQLKAKHTVPTGTYCEKVSSRKRDTRHIFPQGPS